MMKKLFAITLALILALSLAACGASDTPPISSGGDSTTTPPNGDPSQPQSTPEGSDPNGNGGEQGGAMVSLIGWMKDGTYSYDFTMTSEGNGEKTEASGSMAMDGNNMAFATEMTVDGETVKSRVIIKDGITYIVDDVNKFIMKAPGGMNATAGMITDYSGIMLTGSGTGEIGGKTLPYEEYEQEGATVKYYIDGGQVYGIESEYEGYKTVMIITNPSNTVPAGAFDLPAGYTEM